MIAINIKDIGAKGDGVSNDHPYFLKAKDLINRNGSGELIIPPGVYYFDDYIDTDNSSDNVEQNNKKCIDFKQCGYVKITGYNAKLKMKGDFTREAHWKVLSGDMAYWYSGINAIQPLRFFNCENVIIEGIEIDGGVDDTIRGNHIDSNTGEKTPVAETSSYGIAIYNTLFMGQEEFQPLKYLKIDNVNIHHCATDGLLIDANSVENNTQGRMHITNSVFDKNARNGMSIVLGHNIVAENCKFTNSGYQHFCANYGNHAPAAGVDLEGEGEPLNGENPVKKISFRRCEFKGNFGSQFVASFRAEDVSIEDSHIEDHRKGKEGITNGLVLNLRNMLLNNNVIIGDVFLLATQTGIADIFPGYREEIGIQITNNKIYSNRHGIRAWSDPDSFIVPFRIEGNYLEMLDEPVINSAATDVFPLISDKQSFFVGNYIKIHQNRSLEANQPIVSMVHQCKLVTNNVWDVLDNNGTLSEMFAVSFEGANAFNESFPINKVIRPHGYVADNPERLFDV